MSDERESEPVVDPAERPLRKGTEYTLTADAAAFEGGCVARFEGMAVFVSGCVPGDTVRALVTKTKRRYAEARTLEVLAPSPTRVDPPCSYFGSCGGCKWQNLAYEEQLRWKQQHVIDAFERIGGFAGVDVRMTIPDSEEYWYRNKMEFSFGDQRWLTEEEIASGRDFDRDFALGLHVPGRFDRVLDVEKCWLQSDLSNRILNTTRAFAIENGLSIYNTRSHTGLLRNLVVRQSRATLETMIVLVTSDDATETVDRYARYIRVEIPEVTTIIQGINRKKAQIAFSDETRVVYGPGTITEKIAGSEFTLSPFSFFQTNSVQAERLYDYALDAAQLTSTDTVWDLYCGAGTITLAAARRSHRVLGIELNPVSIDDARENAKRNGVDNAEFVAGDLKDVLAAMKDEESNAESVADGARRVSRPDVVITDPPRAGMHENVVLRLLELAPSRIVYVSCNPTTQARDLAILSSAYDVEYVQPVDMFPQTYHIETVARLVRKP